MKKADLRREQLLKIYSKNPSLTNAEIAYKLGVTKQTVSRDIGVLRQEGYILNGKANERVIQPKRLTNKDRILDMISIFRNYDECLNKIPLLSEVAEKMEISTQGVVGLMSTGHKYGYINRQTLKVTDEGIKQLELDMMKYHAECFDEARLLYQIDNDLNNFGFIKTTQEYGELLYLTPYYVQKFINSLIEDEYLKKVKNKYTVTKLGRKKLNKWIEGC